MPCVFLRCQGDVSEFLPLPEPEKRERGFVVSVPPEIKPVVNKYRLEVILLWFYLRSGAGEIFLALG